MKLNKTRYLFGLVVACCYMQLLPRMALWLELLLGFGMGIGYYVLAQNVRWFWDDDDDDGGIPDGYPT